jgi:hypothetical protein
VNHPPVGDRPCPECGSLVIRRPKSLRCWGCGAELDEAFKVTKPGDPQAESEARAAKSAARAARVAAKQGGKKKTAAKPTAAKRSTTKKRTTAKRSATKRPAAERATADGETSSKESTGTAERAASAAAEE